MQRKFRKLGTCKQFFFSFLGEVRNALSVPLENYWEIRAVQDQCFATSLHMPTVSSSETDRGTFD